MTIETRNNGGAVTVKLVGRLDSTTAGDFEEAMNKVLAGKPSSVSIELSEVDYISSKGIRVLVAAYKQLAGKPLTLLAPNASIIELLKMSGLLNLFIIK